MQGFLPCYLFLLNLYGELRVDCRGLADMPMLLGDERGGSFVRNPYLALLTHNRFESTVS